MAERGERVTSRDVPRLLEILESEDDEAQCDALRSLCPCRNRRYDKEVWLAILDVYADTESAAVRDAASHAMETLRGRARSDPRSQELLRWLAANEPGRAAPLDNAVPVWYDKTALSRTTRNLIIPRWERSHRSRANKQR